MKKMKEENKKFEDWEVMYVPADSSEEDARYGELITICAQLKSSVDQMSRIIGKHFEERPDDF